MATVATQQIVSGGLAPSYSAASGGGDEFTPGDSVFLHVKNGSGSGVTVTVVTPGTVVGQAIGDVTNTVAAGGDEFMGPFPAQHFAAADGKADVTWSATTSITFAVLKV